MTLNHLENFFNKVELPPEVWLSESEHITDVKKMIDSHLKILKANSGNRSYLPYFDRLVRLRAKLEAKKNG